MHRKLWPGAPTNERALGQMSSNFQVYFIHISVLKNQTVKNYNRAKKLHSGATRFVFRFFIVYLPKKMETEKWPKAADSPLLHFFDFRKVEYLFNLCHFLQYRQKILVLDCFEFLSVEYKLRSFNANAFKFISHEIK